MSTPVLRSGFDLSSPLTAPIVSSDSAQGALSNGSYQYKITYVTRYGETTASPASNAIIPLSGSVLLSSIPIDTVSNTRERKIYRTGVGNTIPFRLLATIADNITTTYTDIAPDVDLGAIEPHTNFAASIEVEKGWIQVSRPIIHSTDFTLVALGINHATSAQISQFSEYVFVVVPFAGNGIRMPPLTTNMIGIKLTIKNIDTSNDLNIYTFDPAGDICFGPGVPFILPPLVTEDFIATNSLNWTKVGGGASSGTVVASFSAAGTGLTPAVPTTGIVNLGGVLNTTYGGTGVTSLDLGGILYGTGTAPVGVTVGSPGQLLSSGGGSVPAWTGSIVYSGGTITGIPTPSNASDIVNKAYVDAAGSGLSIHTAVRLSTTTTLLSSYNNGAGGVGATLTNAGTQIVLSIDGVATVSGDRILVNNQLNQTQNGVYVVTNIGSVSTNWIMTRSTDFDNSPIGEIQLGDFVFVESGNTLASTGWTQIKIGTGTGNNIIVGTDGILFAQFSGAGTYIAGSGINITGNTISSTGVISVTGGVSGLAFTPTSGNAVLSGGVLSIAYGGTGNTTNTANSSVNLSVTDSNASSTYYPLLAPTSGTGSKSIGIDSTLLRFITTASGSSVTFGRGIAIGTVFGNASALGQSTIAIGRAASSGVVGAIDNIMIGESVGTPAMTGSGNVGIGPRVLSLNANGDFNTAVGTECLQNNTSGDFNTALGASALRANTTGLYNTATGFQSLITNTTMSALSAYGAFSLRANTLGFSNSAFGSESLRNNTSGYFNTAVGSQSMQSNTLGIENTSVGNQALQTNISGNSNSSLGYFALNSNINGSFNTALGHSSLQLNTSGNLNTATGYLALSSNTTASFNTANGTQALQFNMVGAHNSAFGNQALTTTTGSFNTAVGSLAMLNNSSGSQNISFGYQAGDTLTTGSNNCIIGAGADTLANISNVTIIGQGSIANNTGSTIVGRGVTTSSDNAIAVGINATVGASSTEGISIGSSSTVNATAGIAVGRNTVVNSINGVAIGNNITANQANGMFMMHRGVTASVNPAGFIPGTNELVEIPYSSLTPNTISTSIPSLVVPNNLGASLKGVPVGGLYRSAFNGATTSSTFLITSSFVNAGVTLTVTATGSTITPGMFLVGGSVTPGTQIVAQLSGAPGSIGNYQVDQPQLISVAPNSVIFNSVANPDIVYVRTM